MSHATRLLVSSALLSLLLLFPHSTFAISIEGNVEPAANCTIQDKNGAEHAFPKDGSPSGLLAVCVLAKALETGIISSVQLSEFTGFGLFVEGLNGVVSGGDEFWALFRNGVMADCGIECLPVVSGDTISFILTSFDGEDRGSTVVLHITSPIEVKAASSGGGGEFLKDRAFDVAAAIQYLTGLQHPDGSFGSPMLTDWAAIALGAAHDDICNESCKNARDRLQTYLSDSPITGRATDLERRIMALEALGIDPYSAKGAPLEKLIALFDGTQMGDATLVNDDIFALFPLLNAGYATTDQVPNAILNVVLSKQRVNGSWDESVDLTAAAIQALRLFPTNIAALEALREAEIYIRRNQDDSGIFGTRSFTLSWVLQAIAALGQTPQEWKKSGMTPLGYLGVLQQEDGGVEPMSVGTDNRVWATSYAIPAALGKTWDSILSDFAKPEAPETGLVAGTSTTSLESAVPPTPTLREVQADTPKLTARLTAIPSPIPTTVMSSTTAESQIAAAGNAQKDTDNFSLALWVTGVGLIVFFFGYVYARKWVESLDI